MEGKATRKVTESFAAGNSVRNHSVDDVLDQGEIHTCSHQDSKLGSKSCAESNGPQGGRHPIDDILYWHNAIRMELHDIKEETRRMQQSGDFSDISAFNERLQFIADVCIYHRCVDLHLHSFTCCYGHGKDGPSLKCSSLFLSFSMMFSFSKKRVIR
jgi:zinc finger-like protein